MGINLDDYVDVAHRIEKFYEKYPEGSLQSEWEILEVDGQTFVVVVAFAYRDRDDPRPGKGTAWEPFPGLTPYTKGSEIMVGETSSWGRAIAALGFEVKKGIASANEVRAAQERRQPDPKQVKELKRNAKRKTLADALSKAFSADGDAVRQYLTEETGKGATKDLTLAQMDKLIKELAG